jgi:hypothetical protein
VWFSKSTGRPAIQRGRRIGKGSESEKNIPRVDSGSENGYSKIRKKKITIRMMMMMTDVET